MNKPRGLLCTRTRGSKSWCKARGLHYDIAAGSSKTAVAIDGVAGAEQATMLTASRVEAAGAAGAPLEPDLPPSLAQPHANAHASVLAPTPAPAPAAPGPASAESQHPHAQPSVGCVYDIVPDELSHPSLGTFGRLDKDTTGLFLLGTDGGLQTMLLHPESKLPKKYLATLSKRQPLCPDAVAMCAAGICLKDGTVCKPATLEILQYFHNAADPNERGETVLAGGLAAVDGDTDKPGPEQGGPDEGCRAEERGHERAAKVADDAAPDAPSVPALLVPVPMVVRLTIVEGQYHQVKRMIGACGGYVVQLHREAIGPLVLDTHALPEGHVRLLTHAELLALKDALPPRVRTVAVDAHSSTTSRRQQHSVASTGTGDGDGDGVAGAGGRIRGGKLGDYSRDRRAYKQAVAAAAVASASVGAAGGKKMEKTLATKVV